MEASWWLSEMNVVYMGAHLGAAANAIIAKERVILADSVIPGTVVRVHFKIVEAAFGVQ